MWKKISVLLIVMSLLLSGCGKKEIENEAINNESETVVEEDIQQFYDASRLEKNKNYTWEEATKNFSFIVTDYKFVENGDFDYQEPVDVIYSYIGGDNIEFFSKYSSNGLSLIYRFDAYDTVSVTLEYSDYTKENYKEKINEHNTSSDWDWDNDYEIIKEKDNLVYLKKDNSNESMSEYADFYVIKFFDDGKSFLAQSQTYKTNQEKAFTALSSILNTIVTDNKDAILEDKIASIPNYQNKKVRSYKYIFNISALNESYSLNADKLTATVYFSSGGIYSQGNWNVLSSEPYVTYNENEGMYKIVTNGIPQHYKFDKYDEEYNEIKLEGTIKELETMLNVFYK